MMPQNAGGGGSKIAVQVDGRDNRLVGVREDGVLGPPARGFLAFSEVEELTEADLIGDLGERSLTDKMGAAAGELSFLAVWVSAIQLIAYREVQHGISKELQAFVGCDALLVDCIDVGTVFQRLFQERGVGECVPQLFLKPVQRALFFDRRGKPPPQPTKCPPESDGTTPHSCSIRLHSPVLPHHQHGIVPSEAE